MDAIAIIPARIASTRLPRKILREIAGKTMLERVYSAARGCGQLSDVIVATDSGEILSVCETNGWTARLTSDQHRSGTDRVHEVATALMQAGKADESTVFVNVQGDEPLARPEHLDALLRPMQDPNVLISTVATDCKEEDVANPNAVKVVTRSDGRALYFSRSTIPFDRDKAANIAYRKHLGFYAYRYAALDRFHQMPESSLERSERLEQLRFLENGFDILVEHTPHDTIGVDTEADLQRVEQLILSAQM
ncbi:MAG TPA: 3-deoxy-manno-octulosonate cytidylyltransferase [Terriglobales bacterium]|jgi:3-deoxy-manno-octulosonate cytidylyltransferase (CMP-KDO synthetase)